MIHDMGVFEPKLWLHIQQNEVSTSFFLYLRGRRDLVSAHLDTIVRYAPILSGGSYPSSSARGGLRFSSPSTRTELQKYKTA